MSDDLEDAVAEVLNRDPLPVTTLNPKQASERSFKATRPRVQGRCSVTKRVNGIEVRCIKFRHMSELDCAFPIPAAPKLDTAGELSLDELAGWTEEAVQAYLNEALTIANWLIRYDPALNKKTIRLRELISELGRRALGEE